jgi:hypothetical protein
MCRKIILVPAGAVRALGVLLGAACRAALLGVLLGAVCRAALLGVLLGAVCRASPLGVLFLVLHGFLAMLFAAEDVPKSTSDG